MPEDLTNRWQSRNTRGRFTTVGGKLIGVDKMQRKLQNVIKRMPDRVGQALFIEGNDILNVSKKDHVPVDLGALRASGFVEAPVRKGTQVTVTIGYGGPTAAYAVVVHEHPSDMDPRSWQGADVQFSPAGRGPKYLERPFLAAITRMPQRLAARIALENLAR